MAGSTYKETPSIFRGTAPKSGLEPGVIYEDNHLLVLAKPPCMPTVPDASGDPSLLDWGKSYLKRTRNKPGNVFLGVVHRLDRPVSGVICFAVTSKAASRLSGQMRTGDITKIYLAVTEGNPPDEKGLLEHKLIKDRIRNRVRALPADLENPQARHAQTLWRVLAREKGRVLLELNPRTGRPHQLRVQCAAMGCPLLGDLKYGAQAPLPDASIALHAYRLELVHPTRKKTMIFTALPPEADVWRIFFNKKPRAKLKI